MGQFEKLKNQPLQVVLAEFRFSDVRDIEVYVPKVQDRLRSSYPHYTEQVGQKVSIGSAGVKMEASSSWVFSSPNKRRSVLIDQSRVVYFSSEYDRYPGFAAACEELLGAVIEIVQPTLLHRVGLRYGDAVIPDAGETIDQLVDASALFPEAMSGLGKSVQRKTESVLATESGTLVIRSLLADSDLMTWPDLRELPIKFPVPVSASARVILDFDHFAEFPEGLQDFEIDQVIEVLGGLHESSRAAFWSFTTDYARSVKWA